MDRYLILASRWNDLVTKALLSGAKDTFEELAPKAKIDTLWVPGSFELPMLAAKAAKTRAYDGIVCLGAVIRGETPHFDLVAGQAAAGLMKVSIDLQTPIVFGILTTDTVEQALNRCGLKAGNKGAEAASTALNMTSAIVKLEELVAK